MDDDLAVCRSLLFLLGTSGVDARCFLKVEAFLAEVDCLGAGCVLLGQSVQGGSGATLYAQIRARRQDLPVILMSAQLDGSSANAAMDEHIVGFLEKPFDEAELDALLQSGFALIEGCSDRPSWRTRAVEIVASLDAVQLLVVRGLSAGMGSAEIGALVGHEPVKVQRIRARIANRFGLHRRGDIQAMCSAAGLSPLEATGSRLHRCALP